MAQPAPPVVPLPLAPQDPNVHLPPVPAAPPNSNDVLSSVKYQRNVLLSLESRPLGSKCSPQDLKAAVIYAQRIATQAAAHDGGAHLVAPLWFGPAMQQALQPIEDRLDAIEGRLDAIDDRLDAMDNRLGRVQADMKRLINYNHVEGGVIQFDIIPFHDGSDPTQAPHGLPPLHSFQSIAALNGAQLVAYLHGYGYGGENEEPLPVGQNNQATNRLRKDLLKRTVAARS